jgi:hypothetical protein
MPVMLLGAELGLRKAGWSSRMRWLGVAGLAVSQILASWVGQVGYYALLVLGGYLVYRHFVERPERLRALAFRGRIREFLISSAAILAIGFGLAAAGLLPRFQYNEVSNVAGGVYDGGQAYASDVGGWSAAGTGFKDFSRSLYYTGGAVLILALIAIVIARRRTGVWFFLFLSVAALVLASHRETPLHAVLYAVLPRFKTLHEHWPERVAITAFLAPAMLAGAAVDALPEWLQKRRPMTIALGLSIAAIAALIGAQWDSVPWEAVIAGSAAVLLVGVGVYGARSELARYLPVALTVVAVADLAFAGPRIMSAAPYGGFHRLDLSAYYREDGAAQFLKSQTESQPGRYFGYDPALAVIEDSSLVLYRYQFVDSLAMALEVNNRASALVLQDIQGYNPIQLERYVEFLNAINGETQNYHDANVLPSGLSSPLLDLLNVRYILIPTTYPSDRTDLASLQAELPAVYRDDLVTVLERSSALPRAWMVHETQVVEKDDVLPLLASRTIDPRQTAVVETAVSGLAASDSARDQVTTTLYEPERIRLDVDSASGGLVVLSEMSYPGWHVYVDGKRADALEVDYLLRGVVVPAGKHVVEWRFESRSLTIGTLISVLTVLGLIGACIATTVRRRESVLGEERSDDVGA